MHRNKGLTEREGLNMGMYERGKVLTSLDELVKQEFVYWREKITPKGWFMSWQLKMTTDALSKGVIYYANKKGGIDDGRTD